MANFVTVPGSSNTSVTISSTSGDVQLLAQQIGLLLGGGPNFPGTPNNNLSVTTVSGAIPTLGVAEVFLHGLSANYAIANDGGSLYVSDNVPLQDGTQILSGDTLVAFTNGLGVFDPTGAAEDVSRLYEGLLQQAPDVAGLQYWTALINNSHVSLTAVANAFISSPEFQNLSLGTNAAFVAALYANALGRPASNAEATYWTNLLASGTSRGAVAVAFVESPEAIAHSLSTAGDNNEAEVYRLYKTVLGRAPDAAGTGYWSGALAGGSTIAQVAQAFVGSAEFQADYGTSSATAFVTALYQNTFNRQPLPAELQYWANVLQGGASKASVIVAFSDSAESRDDTAAATHANWVFVPSTSTPLTTELLLNGPGGRNTTIPGGYNYVVVNDLTADTLTASNAVIATTNSVGGTFFISGTSTLAATGSNNTVNATGQYDLSFGPGNNVIIAAGSGTVATATGNSTVSVTGPNDLVLAGASATTITASGNSSGLTVNGGTGPLLFVGGANTATIIGGSAGSTVTSGTGGVVFTADGASDSVSLAPGSASTIFGSAVNGGHLAVSGSGALAYTAGAGNVTLNASQASGNVTVDLSPNGLADSVSLGTGNNTVIAGGGSETLGGSGSNLYQFTLGTAGANTTYFVTDASLANDTFSFIGYNALPTLSGNTLTVATGTGNLNVVFSSLPNLTASEIGHIKIS